MQFCKKLFNHNSLQLIFCTFQQILNLVRRQLYLYTRIKHAMQARGTIGIATPVNKIKF